MPERLKKDDFDMVFGLMETSFPTSEHRTYSEQKALLDIPYYDIYIDKDENNLKMFIAVWEFETFRFIEHFAVNPDLRNGGIGSKALKEICGMSDKPVCLEAELPENELAKRRIGFYERNGFFKNDYPYVQPPITAGEPPVPLVVMTSRKINEEDFIRIRDTLLSKVYRVT